MNPELSIVSTLYRSETTVEEFVSRAAAAAQACFGDRFEIILVDDGSPDDSLRIARRLLANVSSLEIVELSRNFGHHIALLAGLEHSRGDLVFLVDSDLEEQPEWLHAFREELVRSDADVVFGYQEKRRGFTFERFSGAAYWRIFRSLTGIPIPSNIVTCRLMSRKYVDSLLRYEESQVSIGGIFALAGFKQHALPVEKGHKGTSTYSFRAKLWHLVNSVASFSTRPLDAIFILGALFTVLGVALGLYLVVSSIFWGQSPAGWTSVMASLWLIGGVIISSIGVLAIYLGKIFQEVKRRPRHLIREIYSSESS